MKIYDLIIIGAGPAGITAAIYAARRKIKFLLIGLSIGGQVTWSSEVENYPGYKSITGIELIQRFQEHLKEYNINLIPETVQDIKKKSQNLIIRTNKKKYETKSIIIASGKRPKRLNVPGESDFMGRGVGYCATCDAPFFKDKKIAVIGGGNSAMEAAAMVSKYAKKTYILDINPKPGAEPYLLDPILKNKSITYLSNAKTIEILGDTKVKGIKYIQDNKEKTLDLEGIFIEIGLITNADFAKIIKKNKWGEIMISRSTRSNDENFTNIPGIFAAGDVTDIPAKQIIVAAGEGAKAAIASFDYIDHQNHKK